MDFLDSLDLDASKHKKSHRVRSWYLYEQFKSLERNQLDATRKLKSRSYQDRILRQELSERRARRKLYDQFEYSQSESGIESNPTKASLNISTDDFYKSFHELQDEELDKIENYDALDEVDSHHDTCQEAEIDCEEAFKDYDDTKDDESGTGSVNSVINVKSEETLTKDMKNYARKENMSKFQMKELNLDDVKQKLQCLERLAHRSFDKSSENYDSIYSIEENELKRMALYDKSIDAPENNINLIWAKLVSFAYQIMELNHGNCYYDYGSQFLTAVLACDVLRRGINRMCHILQPYVSPLKYNTDSDSDTSQKNAQRKKRRKYYYRNKSGHKLHYANNHFKRKNTHKSYVCKDFWDYSPFSAAALHGRQFRGASEPCPQTSYENIWSCLKNDVGPHVNTCSCSCQRVVNPMLHLSLYLEQLMADLNNPIT